ncbi:LysR substrate-binding domain-containing protein [Cucumibacter marinus]|uniref:LysR substrate-binding domain-containing protein n=1 Tax=Cucumibacter marinus TaxID=1121252 RepID=UPI0004124914|nr:LysR substrate-binding domain-containing protein [Cucumibacter marinus]
MSGLIAFEATARHLSFSQAAKDLSLSQGAVSKRVRQLEQALGVSLLARNNHQVHLTEIGSSYLPEVRTLLGQLESSTRTLINRAQGKSAITIAVLPSFATHWLIPRLGGFRHLYPDILVNLKSRLRPFDLAAERMDGAFHFGTPHWPEAKVSPLFGEDLVPVASPEMLRASRANSPADLIEGPLLHLSSRPGLWCEWFEMAGHSFGQPPGGASYDQFSMIIAAAVHGQGAAIVPRFMVEAELRSGALSVVFDHPLKSERSYYFITPLHACSDPHVTAFNDWVGQCAAEYTRQGDAR